MLQYCNAAMFQSKQSIIVTIPFPGSHVSPGWFLAARHTFPEGWFLGVTVYETWAAGPVVTHDLDLLVDASAGHCNWLSPRRVE